MLRLPSGSARALIAGALMAVGAGPAFAISADAQKVVDQVVKENPNVKPICSDRGKLRDAVTAATTELAKGHLLTGDAGAAGQEAGKYLYTHCPPG